MSEEIEDGAAEKPRQAKGGGATVVYETLKLEILSLKLSPGAPLDETTLAQRFFMSRSPIRKALVRLSGDGLVEMLPNRSTLVAPINLTEFPRYVEALDLMQRVNTRLAVKHRTANHIETPATNRDFHMAVAAAGKNSYFARSYGQLLDEGRRIFYMHFDFLDPPQPQTGWVQSITTWLRQSERRTSKRLTSWHISIPATSTTSSWSSCGRII